MKRAPKNSKLARMTTGEIMGLADDCEIICRILNSAARTANHVMQALYESGTPKANSVEQRAINLKDFLWVAADEAKRLNKTLSELAEYREEI